MVYDGLLLFSLASRHTSISPTPPEKNHMVFSTPNLNQSTFRESDVFGPYWKWVLYKKTTEGSTKKTLEKPKDTSSTAFLVGGWTNPVKKYARQNGESFPSKRGRNQKKSWKPQETGHPRVMRLHQPTQLSSSQLGADCHNEKTPWDWGSTLDLIPPSPISGGGDGRPNK